MKILLVEDDEYMTLTLKEALTHHNYLIETINDGQTGLELAKAFDYDLLLLDIMLPRVDGITLCRQLRLEGCQLPIILLTAKDSAHDRVTGLEAGADDYVIKPFVLSELVARIRALLRRGRAILPAVLTWENLQLNFDIREVTYNGKRLFLTPKEYSLLGLFLRNPNNIYSRSDLLDRIWSSTEFPGEEAVTTHIKGLRQKLKAAGMTVNLIETVYGVGYRLKKEEKEPTPAKIVCAQDNCPLSRGGCLHTSLPKPEQSNYKQSAEQVANRDKTNLSFHNTFASYPSKETLSLKEKYQIETEVITVIKNVWEEFRESHLEQRLELLDQTLASLSTGTLDSHLLTEAHIEAHRLSGSLGCYGFPEGSKLAQEIEMLLQALMMWHQSKILWMDKLKKLKKILEQSLQQQISQEEDKTKECSLREEFELFKQAIATLSTVTLETYPLKKAQEKAQGLAATLKCSGFDKGSKVAWEIELLLKSIRLQRQSASLGLQRLKRLIKLLKQILQQSSAVATSNYSGDYSGNYKK